MAKVFRVEFIRRLEGFVLADSLEEAQEAADRHANYGDIDDWNPDDWEANVYSAKYNVNGGVLEEEWDGPEPDMGVAEGEMWSIEDYRQKVGKEEHDSGISE